MQRCKIGWLHLHYESAMRGEKGFMRDVPDLDTANRCTVVTARTGARGHRVADNHPAVVTSDAGRPQERFVVDESPDLYARLAGIHIESVAAGEVPPGEVIQDPTGASLWRRVDDLGYDSQAVTVVLAELFADAVGQQRVGVQDDFFHIGGNSLAAIRLAAAASRTFGVVVSPRDLLDAPTVAALERRIADRGGDPNAAGPGHRWPSRIGRATGPPRVPMTRFHSDRASSDSGRSTISATAPPIT